MNAKKRANKSTYTGELATPIYEPVSLVGGLGGSKDEAEGRAQEQRLVKMEKLFDWYSIDPDEPDAGMCLAVTLALAHVPGMQVLHEPQKRRGRKRSWEDGLGSELVRDVDALRQNETMNDKQAIETLRNDKKSRWSSYSQANLIARHREARQVERDPRRFAERSSFSQAMGTVFGMGISPRTAENSKDQN